jgi:hypothetical protein
MNDATATRTNVAASESQHAQNQAEESFDSALDFMRNMIPYGFAGPKPALSVGVYMADRPDLQGGDSIVWIELDESRSPAGILVRSAAALRLSRYLGGGWRLLSAAWIVPRPVRDWVYDVVAARRHRIGRKENCLVPTKETRQRFLDDDRSC